MNAIQTRLIERLTEMRDTISGCCAMMGVPDSPVCVELDEEIALVQGAQISVPVPDLTTRNLMREYR